MRKFLVFLLIMSCIFIYSVPTYADNIDEGYTNEITDENIDSNWQYYCNEIITITGTKDEIIINPNATDYNVQPGDGGYINVTIKNDSDKEYNYVTKISYDSIIKNYYVEYYNYDFDTTICNYLKNTSRAEASPVTKWIEQNIVKEDTYNPNSRKFRDYVTSDNVLAAYNAINETSFTDLKTAWNYNFFNKCWKLSYSKEWSDVDYTNGDVLTISWSTDGYNTDNAYMNTVWNWGDSITIKVKEEAQESISDNNIEEPTTNTDTEENEPATSTDTADEPATSTDSPSTNTDEPVININPTPIIIPVVVEPTPSEPMVEEDGPSFEEPESIVIPELEPEESEDTTPTENTTIDNEKTPLSDKVIVEVEENTVPLANITEEKVTATNTDTNSNDDIPKTGDDSNIILWSIITIIAGIGTYITYKRFRKL